MSTRFLTFLSVLAIFVAAPFSVQAQPQPVGPGSSGLRLIQSDDRGIQLQLSTPGYEIESVSLDGQDFQRLAVPGAGMSSQAGMPQVPMVSTLLGVPAGVQVVLHVSEDDVRSLPVDFTLAPVPQPEAGAPPMGSEAPSGEDSALQDSSASMQAAPNTVAMTDLYPQSAVRIAGDAWLRDQRILRVEFYPFQVEPGGKTIRWHRNLRVELSFANQPGVQSPQVESQTTPSPFEAALEGSLLNYDSARAWRTSPQYAADPLPESLLSTDGAVPPRYKIVVDQDGLYRMSYDDLKKAGMPVDSVDPATFHLTSQGQDVSIYVAGEGDGSFDAGDWIEFYGRKFHGEHLAQLYASENQNWLNDFIFYSDGTHVHWQPEFNATMLEKYTEENVYWLTVGGTPGPRMAAVSGTPATGATVPSSYRTTVHAEQSHEWWTWHFTGEDTWFWDYVSVNPTAPVVTNTYTTTLSAVATDGPPADVHAEVVARTFNNYAAPDHHTLFYLNDRVQPLEDASWDGHTRHTFDAQVPATDLLDRENSLHFVVEKTPAMVSDRIYFDFFEIEYSRRFQAEGDQLFFSYDENGSALKYEIGNITSNSASVFDVSDEFDPVRILNPVLSAGGTLSFGASHPAAASYLVVGESAIQKPKSITYDAPPNLLSATNAADYIIITHADFISASQTLADYRAAQGMRTMVVDVQDLYDEFNFGIYNPIAIKNFLAYTFAHWQAAPAYVLLVGSGHWNFKGYTGISADYWSKPIYMPPNLGWVDPWQGETDSANLLAAVVGDDILPDLSIGRLPVDTVEQLDAAISKTIAYENSPHQSWQKRLMFVADNTPDLAGDFVGLSEAVISDHVPLDYQVDRIYLDDYGCLPGLAGSCPQVTHAITSTLNLTGTLFVNYIGHAADSSWTSEAVLRTTGDPADQADPTKNHLITLANGDKLPVVLSMTCLDGYWFHTLPDKISLAAELVRSPDRGAVATFSPTGLGVSQGHDVLNRAFYDAIFKDGVWRLGPATIASKLAMYASGSHFDLINTFTIFGDPALHMLSPNGLDVTPATDAQLDDPGSVVTYTLGLENTGTAADTFDVVVSGNQWTVSAPASVGPIPAGESEDVLVRVEIPKDISSSTTDTAELTFISRGDIYQSALARLTTSQRIFDLFLPLIH